MPSPHIAYRLDFKLWSVRSQVHKELLRQRKTKISSDFRELMRLIVDQVNIGHI